MWIFFVYSDDLYNDLAATVVRARTNDGWSTGYEDVSGAFIMLSG